MLKCKILDPETADWEVIDRFEDRTVFQTREWLRFVADTQNAIPLLVELREENDVAGYFTGLTFSKFGLKVLGSSFPGWTTPYMGFNLRAGISRTEALGAMEEIAWGSLKCLHMEVSDPYFTVEDGQAHGFACEFYASYRTDLTPSEDTLFNNMESACRRCVRKAEKSGVVIEEALDLDFADEYYVQLQDVFAKQGLVPTYTVDRVRSLIKNLAPSGRLLLLRARDPQGACIATGIYPGFNRIAEFWGNASFRASQALRPNEMIHWYAMRYWKRHGIEIFDWGGEGTYKEKYGCVPHKVPWFTKSRNPLVAKLRNEARKMFLRKQRFLGWVQGRGESKTQEQSGTPA
jgi:hypothetical protein